MDIRFNGKEILFNHDLEASFKELEKIVSGGTLINVLDCIIMFILHTLAYGKQLYNFIHKNNNKIGF